MSFPKDQQPIQRTVGKRTSCEGRQLTGADLQAARAAMTRNARYYMRAPKGVFYYSSHDEMAADRLRWTVDLMAELDREGRILVSTDWPAESG
jgi:hypothetical protein